MTDETNLPVEPVEIAAPVETESAPVAVETPPDDAGQAPVVEDKVPDSVQKRIDKAIGKMREQERRSEALERRNDELVDLLMKGGALKQPDAPPAPSELKKPTLAQFEYDEAEYEVALDAYFEAKAEQVVERKLDTLKANAQEARTVESYESRAKVFAESVPDFAEVTSDRTLPISKPMAAVIKASEVGPALYYHLAQNRDLAGQLAQLPAEVAAYELGKIEARIAQPTPTPTPPPKARVSNAPPPVPTIVATEPEIEKDPAKMSDPEFARWRKRQIAQRR